MNSNFQNSSQLELQIQNVLKRIYPKNPITVKVVVNPSNPNELKTLSIKIENIREGLFSIDIFTIIFQNPKLDFNALKKNTLKIPSANSFKANVFLSPDALENYIQSKSKSLGRKNVNVSIKLSSPFVEATYDVPTSQIGKESQNILSKFITKSLNGYAAFTFKVKNNALSAYSTKVILNHFLLPEQVLKYFTSNHNPFEEVPQIYPFSYRLNNVTVQKNYLYLSN
ncbi:MAG TPA: hypothetical protein PKY56_02795 [Candidatus Kapabacteria bacterium]|nr:hypothetical protein [Candidatus Kapabacteria bacterium]HPO62291.1 hypothetical protein [Candidatus Kapabacteria bacterium]